MSVILIVALSNTLTEMHYLFFLFVGQPDVDMCEFCMAELLVTLISHSCCKLWCHNLMIG